jgi:hypothetical protein
MQTFFHVEQLLHHPRSDYSRSQMRTPQEVPERARNLLLAAQSLGLRSCHPRSMLSRRCWLDFSKIRR